jgi:hypothetical protein
MYRSPALFWQDGQPHLTGGQSLEKGVIVYDAQVTNMKNLGETEGPWFCN